ncbi:hypothetical protein PTSG_06919 [Salpingoeca rosetta]|uniref:Transmembrane protein n=1 Tax=Salpingoeca rosetta (strain ATCC 50818 / BSB-021) TaxID=946362 RepID=F2UF66_SALR5|nr:uncharacterized protein PTSG_06919 [Salpingoeca rosetta]EGD75266.1 hypothetical protein PTSG_06919 [Salpingoeca rosetta]|eukprot:XP_004992319.1 hypothetical protein PTSG_06919 [Salpingoeca rosetta]
MAADGSSNSGTAAGVPAASPATPRTPTTPLLRQGSSTTRVSNSLLGKIHSAMYYQNWSLIISALSLLASVVYFYNALALMKSGSEASLFNDILSEYSSPQMLDSLRTLRRFYDTHQDDYAAVFIEEYKHNSDQAWELEHARRRVEAWYSKVMHFHQFDLLHDKYLSVFPGRRRAIAFLQLVEPLSEALSRFHEADRPGVFAYVRKLYHLTDKDTARSFPKVQQNYKDNHSGGDGSSSTQPAAASKDEL